MSRQAAIHLLQSVYELSGESMSPTLERGWTVSVGPQDRTLEPGDVVLIDAPSGHVIHRYLGTVTWGSPPQEFVVHAGDSSVLSAVVPASWVKGRVHAVVHPGGRPITSLHELPPDVRRRFARFSHRWKLFAGLRRLAEVFPPMPRPFLSAATKAARRTLQLG